MKRESSTQSSYDLTFDLIDMLLSTPNDNMKARLQTALYATPWQPTSTDQLDDVLQSLQDVARTCRASDSDSGREPCYQTSTNSFVIPDVKSPQLDISLLDDMVLQELSDISSELSFYTSVKSRNRRESKAKRRLFSPDRDEDDEPSPKRQRTDIADAWDSDLWTFSDRRS